MLKAALNRVLRLLGLRRAAEAADESPQADSAAAAEPPPESAAAESTQAASDSSAEPETAESEESAEQDQSLSYAQTMRKLHELAFGIHPLEMPSSPEHAGVAAATRGALQTAISEPRYMPRRPMLLPQLMQAVNDNDVSRRALAALIVRDPALTGNLLKLANSTFYRAGSQPVESIDRAISLLGTEGIRSLIAAAVMQPVFRVAGGVFARFPEIAWEHTFLSGTAAAAYAAMIAHDDPFAGQLLALVNGLASIVVFRVALDQYRAQPGLRPDAAVISSLIEAHGAQLARGIAASWDLSERVLDALTDQTPEAAQRESSPLGLSLRMGQLLSALAVLRADASIDADTAQATVEAHSRPNARLEGIWMRLSTRATKS